MTRMPALSALVVALVLGAVAPAVASSVCDQGDSRREPTEQRERPIRWQGADVTRDGRTLLISVQSGFSPPKKVVVRERARSVTVTVFERRRAKGSPPGPDIGVTRCVRVRLRAPLGERRLFDGRAPRKRRVARDNPDGRGCLRLPIVRR
jgi:hypothetical protein